MFRKDLEQKLKNIFGVKKVIWDRFTLGKEMDALFCNVELVRPYRTSGRMNFWVTGTIELCSDAGKNNYGWLSGKIETARKEYTKELAFSRDENPIQFEHNNSDFVKNYIYFSYAHSVQFNDIQEKIEAVQWPERN